MAPLDDAEINTARGFGAKFFKPSALKPSESSTITIVDINKNHATKWPLRGKDYCYRATLEDGRVWDCNSVPVAGALIRYGYPAGSKTLVKFTVKITRKDANKIGESPYDTEKV